MGAEDILREHIVEREGRDPEWAEAVIAAVRECKEFYPAVGCARRDGWAFLMPKERFLKLLKQDRTATMLHYNADIAIGPTGKVRKHRWRIPDAP